MIKPNLIIRDFLSNQIKLIFDEKEVILNKETKIQDVLKLYSTNYLFVGTPIKTKDLIQIWSVL